MIEWNVVLPLLLQAWPYRVDIIVAQDAMKLHAKLPMCALIVAFISMELESQVSQYSA